MAKTILVVNDDKEVLKAVSEALSEKTYHVEIHEHSWDTLFAFYNTPSRFDLVITDLSMADISGLTLAEKILHLRPRMPVILFMPQVGGEAESMAREVGVRWVLPKPVSKEELLAAVRQALRRPRQGER